MNTFESRKQALLAVNDLLTELVNTLRARCNAYAQTVAIDPEALAKAFLEITIDLLNDLINPLRARCNAYTQTVTIDLLTEPINSLRAQCYAYAQAVAVGLLTELINTPSEPNATPIGIVSVKSG